MEVDICREMRKMIRLLGYVAAVVAILSSCKSTETVTAVRLRNMPAKRIISQVVENNSPYQSMSCSKVGISIKGGDTKGSLRGMMKILNDSVIYISASKVTIPVAKILISPDSVKMVNYLQKNYMISDMEQVADKFNLNLDFQMLQSILSYEPFSDFDQKKSDQYKDYVSFSKDGKYILQSATNRKIEKVLKKKDKRKDLRAKFLSDYQIIQRIYIDPETFLVDAFSLIDYAENRELWIRFSDFQTSGDKKFPKKIKVMAKKQDDMTEIELTFGRISLNKNEKIIFNIPNKYQPLSKANK